MDEYCEMIKTAYKPVQMAQKLFKRMDFETSDKRDKQNAAKLLKIYTDSVNDFKKSVTTTTAELCALHMEAIKEARGSSRRDASPARKRKPKDLSD